MPTGVSLLPLAQTGAQSCLAPCQGAVKVAELMPNLPFCVRLAKLRTTLGNCHLTPPEATIAYMVSGIKGPSPKRQQVPATLLDAPASDPRLKEPTLKSLLESYPWLHWYKIPTNGRTHWVRAELGTPAREILQTNSAECRCCGKLGWGRPFDFSVFVSVSNLHKIFMRDAQFPKC